MRATLPDRAPNTYYGQWLDVFLRESRSKIGGQCPLGESSTQAYPQPWLLLDQPAVAQRAGERRRAVVEPFAADRGIEGAGQQERPAVLDAGRCDRAELLAVLRL